jgi:iron complex outermembrane receptor protein
VLVLAIPAAHVHAQSPDFAELSLEQLVHYEVSTLGRKNATVFDTPAPAQVLSFETIIGSGATTVPEALRLLAGVQVSRIDAIGYAITVRGFNDATSSKLLVLKDSRSVYNQLSSGTNWGLLDLVMEDLSRIEVQRGPAGTLWGANAVNGVINIVTKNAHSTLGSVASAATGSGGANFLSVRHGFTFNPATAIRVYAKYQHVAGEMDGSPGSVQGWNSRLVGSRLDWDRLGGGGLSVIGEFRELRTDAITGLPSLLPPFVVTIPEQRRDRSAEMSARWSQPIFGDGLLSGLAAIERGDTTHYQGDERHTTVDVELQVTLHPFIRHEVIAGATYRSTADRIRNSPWLIYDQTNARTNFSGIFLQDEISIIPDRLSLTAGAKLERNSYSGWETQPSLRALWHPAKNQSVWAAISRAARTPSRGEHGVKYFVASLPPTADLPLPTKIEANGESTFSSEHVTSFELGHRFDAGSRFSIDTALFYSRYSDLRGLNPSLSGPIFTEYPPHFYYKLDATNSLRAHTAGGEFTLRWHPVRTFELTSSIASVRTWVQEIAPGQIPDPSAAGLIGNTPHQEYKLHATWHPREHWTIDAVARHTDRLRAAAIPAYNGLDLRLAWLLRPDLELSVVGTDLLRAKHTEIAASFLGGDVRPIPRRGYLQITYRH